MKIYNSKKRFKSDSITKQNRKNLHCCFVLGRFNKKIKLVFDIPKYFGVNNSGVKTVVTIFLTNDSKQHKMITKKLLFHSNDNWFSEFHAAVILLRQK